MLRTLISDIKKSLDLRGSFSVAPMLYLKTNKEFCPQCQSRLKVYRTDTRKIHLLDIGQCKVHRTFMFCPDCEEVFPCENFEKWVPPNANAGYDVIVLAGRLMLCEHHTIKETVLKLAKRNVHLSSSQVAYLAQRFIVYLSVLHQQSSSLVKRHVMEKGGYILHVDGTSDGSSPHLISAIDEVSNFVLANVKVSGESKDQLVPFLEQIKALYGNPLAVSSDMGRGLLTGIAEVFPGIPHFICHFHFLRDLGKDLLEKDYAVIRKKLKRHKISAKLRYRMRYEFGDSPQYIHPAKINQVAQLLNPVSKQSSKATKQICHVLLLWALDGRKHGNGLGFPFDRPHMEFYRRLQLLWEQLDSLQQKCITNKPVSKCIARIINDLSPVVNDLICQATFRRLTKKQTVFDNLRQALFIALPETNKGLNDAGEDESMTTIKNKVTHFKVNLVRNREYHKCAGYQKLIKQIDKYWEKLFCDPIKVSSAEGNSIIQPQRTNNILEQFFRGVRRSYRRATGNNSMRKKLESMAADTPLVRNLENTEYMSLVLTGRDSLEEAFAQINQAEVLKKTQEVKKDERKIPRKVLTLIRENDTMQKLLYLTAI